MANNNAQKQDSILKLGLILLTFSLVAASLLGIVYEVTKEPIRIQAKKENDNALQQVLPKADGFDLVEDMDKDGYDNIKEIYKASNDEGYAFKVSSFEGYGGEIVIVVGVGPDNKLKGIDVLSHAETPGLGANADSEGFKQQFVDKSVENSLNVVKGQSSKENDIEALTGATITSRAVTNAVNDVMKFYNEKITSKGGQQ